MVFNSEAILLTGPVTGDLSVRWVPRISAVFLATAIRGGAGRNMGSILPTEKGHLHATLSRGDAGITGEVRGFGIAYKYRLRVTMSFFDKLDLFRPLRYIRFFYLARISTLE